ncbi:hypothetical protein TNCV_3458281 [Trichonephila clavipes]|nr:hypothetical protein TNCV_3458281 [Trichonephila clavipes]
MSSSLVTLKTRSEGVRCMLNLSRAQTSYHWYGVVARRRGCQLRYCPHAPHPQVNEQDTCCCGERVSCYCCVKSDDFAASNGSDHFAVVSLTTLPAMSSGSEDW